MSFSTHIRDHEAMGTASKAYVAANTARTLETKTGDFSAVVGGRYITETGSVISITDPTTRINGSALVAGDSYQVWVGSGTAWFGGAGTVYSPSSWAWRRRYTGSVWETLAPLVGDAIAFSGTAAKGTVTNLTGVVDDANTGAIQLVASDSGYVKRCTHSSGATIQTPSADPGAGWSMMFIQAGAGQLTFAVYPASGHTINQADSFTKTRKQHSVATLIRVASGVYNLSGDLA